MAQIIQQTTITPKRVIVTISDHSDPEQCTLSVQVIAQMAPNRDEPLAVVQARALAAAREAISAQIQLTTRVHGPIPQ